jgi:hypothetical protein
MRYRRGTKHEPNQCGMSRGWLLAKFRGALEKSGIDNLEQSKEEAFD